MLLSKINAILSIGCKLIDIKVCCFTFLLNHLQGDVKIFSNGKNFSLQNIFRWSILTSYWRWFNIKAKYKNTSFQYFVFHIFIFTYYLIYFHFPLIYIYMMCVKNIKTEAVFTKTEMNNQWNIFKTLSLAFEDCYILIVLIQHQILQFKKMRMELWHNWHRNRCQILVV